MSATRKTTQPDGAATPETSAANSFFPFLGPTTSPSATNASASITAQAALIGVDAMENALVAWRRLFDMSRTALRGQQDIALAALRAQCAGAAEPHAESSPAASSADNVFAPMIAAAKAYEHLGEAMLGAQREALEALAQRPH